MSKTVLRAVDPNHETNRDIARRRVAEYRHRPFRWKITPEEYAQVQAATIREGRVNWALVAKFNRIRRWQADNL